MLSRVCSQFDNTNDFMQELLRKIEDLMLVKLGISAELRLATAKTLSLALGSFELLISYSVVAREEDTTMYPQYAGQQQEQGLGF